MSLIPEETLTEIRQRLRAHHEPLTFSCGEACFELAHHDVRALLDGYEQLRARVAELEADQAARETALREQLAGRIQGFIDSFEVPEEWQEAIDAYKDTLAVVRGEVGDGR